MKRTVLFTTAALGVLLLSPFTLTAQYLLGQADFNDQQLGPYSRLKVSQDFDMETLNFSNNLENHAEIVTSDRGKSLKIFYPGDGKQSLGSGAQFTTAFYPQQEATLEYAVKFLDDFNFSRGGKLPGFCGQECISGCDDADGSNGWSMRYMWYNGNGENDNAVSSADLTVYDYTVDTDENCGDRVKVNGITLQRNTWYTIKQRVRLSGVNQKDGSVTTWVNGQELGTQSGYRMRTIDGLLIDRMFFSTFYGGSQTYWAPGYDTYALFDDFKVWGTTQPPEVSIDLARTIADFDQPREALNNTGSQTVPVNNLEAEMYYVDDKGESSGSIDFSYDDNGKKVAKVDYSLRNNPKSPNTPFMLFGMALQQSKDPVDFSDATGISLEYKGGGPATYFRVETSSISSGDSYWMYLPYSESWTTVAFTWDQLMQPYFTQERDREALTTNNIRRLSFALRGVDDNNVDGTFYVDNIRLLGVGDPVSARQRVHALQSKAYGAFAALSAGGKIFLQNIPQNTSVSLYTLDGRLVHRVRSSLSHLTLDPKQLGATRQSTFIVQAGSEVRKLSL